jgi:hypothetical protein
MPTFQETAAEQPIHQVVMPLFAVRHPGEELFQGTAFLIGEDFALTAWHVIQGFLQRYEIGKPVEGEVATSFEMLGYFSLDGFQTMLPVRVLRFWRIAPLDIAVLWLGSAAELPGDYPRIAPALDLLPPPVGTPVVGFGFHHAAFEYSDDSEAPTFRCSASTTTGEVIEIHHTFRDSARLTFPCFRTNMRFEGGMSGGPVLNNRSGRVCGVICSSFPAGAGADDEDDISYASSLWPVVMTILDRPLEGQSKNLRYPLMDLFQKGVLPAAHLDKVKLTQSDDGVLRAAAQYDSKVWDNPPTA